jgi:hypothetical protein
MTATSISGSSWACHSCLPHASTRGRAYSFADSPLSGLKRTNPFALPSNTWRFVTIRCDNCVGRHRAFSQSPRKISRSLGSDVYHPDLQIRQRQLRLKRPVVSAPVTILSSFRVPETQSAFHRNRFPHRFIYRAPNCQEPPGTVLRWRRA